LGNGRPVAGAPVPAQVGWWWAWGATAAGSLVLTGGSTGLGAAISVNDSFWILFCAIFVLAGIGLVVWPQVVARGREERRAHAVTSFNDGMSSLYSALARFLRAEPTKSSQEVFFRSSLEAAAGLFALDGIRVCVYILDSDDGEKEGLFLRLADSAGRNDAPRDLFEPGTDHGDALIKATIERRQLNMHSRDDPGFPIDFHSGTVWRSFFTIPLGWKDADVAGVLTVDRREETKFTSEDITVGFTVARLLVIGLDRLYGAAKDTAPEVSEALFKLGAEDDTTSPKEATDDDD